jgi:hypothetical protein
MQELSATAMGYLGYMIHLCGSKTLLIEQAAVHSWAVLYYIMVLWR